MKRKMIGSALMLSGSILLLGALALACVNLIQDHSAAESTRSALEELEQLVIDARFECTGPYAKLTTTEYAETLTKMLELIRSIDEVNES